MKQFKFILVLLAVLIVGSANAAQLTGPGRLKYAADLPIIISKAKTGNQDRFVLFISGDGGWNSFSQKLVETYTSNGFNVIGLNSFKYFWKKKTPQQAADDIAAILSTYENEWHKQKIIILGFSFGADVAPFIYTHLPETVKNKITLVQLISPSSYTDFEIHVMDMLGSGNAVRSMNIAAEVTLVNVPVIFYYGEQEDEKPLATFKKANLKTIVLAGDHHYAKSYPEIVKNAL